MAKTPFKVGDRVYVYPDGWGLVGSLCGKENKIVGVERMVDGGLETQYANQSIVSFTEYDPINGGLSHERPYNQLSESEKKAIDRNTPKNTAGGGNYHSPWGKALEDAAKKTKQIHPSNYGDERANGTFTVDDVKFKLDGHLLKKQIDRISSKEDDGRYKIKEGTAATRNLKALEYIKKLLLDGYDITDDFIGVEELGDRVDVSLTFTKESKSPKKRTEG